MSRLAIFGGTFDPVHCGHLLIAESARQMHRLDRVLFVPAGLPPHKNRLNASAIDRLAMVRLAIRGNPYFAVSDWEIAQKRVVYTYETLRHFQSAGREKLFFIEGSDALRDIDQWRMGRELLSECQFLVFERPGTPWSSLPATLRRRAKLVSAPAVSFASRDIRAHARSGFSIRYQVPDAIASYIHQKRLYRGRKGS